MKTLIIGLALLFMFAFFIVKRGNASTFNQHPAIKLINTETLQQAIKNNQSLQLVDVRKAMEFKMGYIKPAINIDYFGSDFLAKFKSFDKETPVYVYCRSGARSNKAAHLLAKEGFKEIYDLQGGFLAWK